MKVDIKQLYQVFTNRKLEYFEHDFDVTTTLLLEMLCESFQFIERYDLQSCLLADFDYQIPISPFYACNRNIVQAYKEIVRTKELREVLELRELKLSLKGGSADDEEKDIYEEFLKHKCSFRIISILHLMKLTDKGIGMLDDFEKYVNTCVDDEDEENLLKIRRQTKNSTITPIGMSRNILA